MKKLLLFILSILWAQHQRPQLWLAEWNIATVSHNKLTVAPCIYKCYTDYRKVGVVYVCPKHTEPWGIAEWHSHL